MSLPVVGWTRICMGDWGPRFEWVAVQADEEWLGFLLVHVDQPRATWLMDFGQRGGSSARVDVPQRRRSTQVYWNCVATPLVWMRARGSGKNVAA